MKLHIGIDDTDSPQGGCTTYIAAKLAEKLLNLGAEFTDYPNIIRLNPNTPWKTRGNASICLRLDIEKEKKSIVKSYVIDLIDEYGEFSCENTNPGAVFLEGIVPSEIKAFSKHVIQEIVSLEKAEKLIDSHGLDAVGYKNRRGLIGALAAVGATLEQDHTFELIPYRCPENWGTMRKVIIDSVVKMDRELKDSTFNNLDEKGKALITPNGPDPVLYGVRGESPDAVYRAFQIIEAGESVERWMIYRTNQGTEAHFSGTIMIKEAQPYNPAVVEGIVTDSPETIRGGHVIFRIKDRSGEIDCAAYEPTGSFRHTVWELIKGDYVKVYGGIRPFKDSRTLNIEKLEILAIEEAFNYVNPRCPECGGSMASMGVWQGFRCKRCRNRDRELVKVSVEKERNLAIGFYLPDKGAQRHLTKPLERYGREKEYIPGPLFTPWIG